MWLRMRRSLLPLSVGLNLALLLTVLVLLGKSRSGTGASGARAGDASRPQGRVVAAAVPVRTGHSGGAADEGVASESTREAPAIVSTRPERLPNGDVVLGRFEFLTPDGQPFVGIVSEPPDWVERTVDALAATPTQATEIRRLHEAILKERLRAGERGAAEGVWPADELVRLQTRFAEQAFRIVSRRKDGR